MTPLRVLLVTAIAAMAFACASSKPAEDKKQQPESLEDKKSGEEKPAEDSMKDEGMKEPAPTGAAPDIGGAGADEKKGTGEELEEEKEDRGKTRGGPKDPGTIEPEEDEPPG